MLRLGTSQNTCSNAAATNTGGKIVIDITTTVDHVPVGRNTSCNIFSLAILDRARISRLRHAVQTPSAISELVDESEHPSK
jgi:hypothetical protein